MNPCQHFHFSNVRCQREKYIGHNNEVEAKPTPIGNTLLCKTYNFLDINVILKIRSVRLEKKILPLKSVRKKFNIRYIRI